MNAGLGSFFLSIGVDINDLNQGLRNAQSRIDEFGSRLENIGSKLSIGLSAPLALVAKSALDASGEFESLQTSFNTMLGSVEAGKQMMQDLQKFNLSTPFESKEVATATKSLLAFGFAQEQIIPNLSRIGDISAGVGMSVQELADIYGKARVQGTLMAEDINQLTGRGIPVLQEFAKQLGVSESQVKALGSEGKISFANLEQAFISLTSEGGKFFGMTANQATTWQGVMSNASDSINQSLVTLGDTIIKSLNLKEVIPQATAYLSELVDAFKNLSPEAQKAITIIGGLAIVIPPLMVIAGTALPMMASGFTALISPVGLVTVAIGALVAVLGEHYLTTKKIESALNSMNEVNQEVSNSIRTEVDEITKLNDILQSNTTSYDEKKQALEKLQQINPQYFGGLNAENLNYSELNRSLSLYIENLRNAQEAKQLSEKLTSNQALVAELKKDPSKGISYAQGVGIALVSPKGQQQFKNNVKNIVDDQIRTIEQENLRMKHQLTNLKIKGYGVSDLATSTSGATAKTGAGAGAGSGKANKDLQKQLEEDSKLYEGLINDIQKMYINSMIDTNRREIELLKYNSNEELKEYEKRIKGREGFENLFAFYRLNKEKEVQEKIFQLEQKNKFIPKEIKGADTFKGFDMKATDKSMQTSLNNMLQLGVNAQIASNNVANLEKFLGLAQGTIDKTNYQAYADQAQIVLDANGRMKDSLMQLSAEAIVSLGDMIGQMITGTQTIKDLGMVLLDTLSKALAQFAMIRAVQGIGEIFSGNIAGGIKNLGLGLGLGVGSGILKGMANKAQNQQQPTNQQQQYSVIRGGDIFTAQNRYQLIKGF